MNQIKIGPVHRNHSIKNLHCKYILLLTGVCRRIKFIILNGLLKLIAAARDAYWRKLKPRISQFELRLVRKFKISKSKIKTDFKMAQHGPASADHNGGRRPAEEGHNRYLLSCARFSRLLQPVQWQMKASKVWPC